MQSPRGSDIPVRPRFRPGRLRPSDAKIQIVDILIAHLRYKPDSIVKLSMRRLAAHLALAAIWLGSLGPFVATAQNSSVHACCLRSGLHHCQNSSSDTSSSDAEFRAPKNACPYSAPLPLTTFTGLETSIFGFASPIATGYITRKTSVPDYLSPLSELPARGPPVLL